MAVGLETHVTPLGGVIPLSMLLIVVEVSDTQLEVTEMVHGRGGPEVQATDAGLH
jgi:hypothetical protein